MKKTNKIIYLSVLFTFIGLVGLLSINQIIVNSDENLNENLQIELPTEPEEITLETPSPKPSWAGSMTNITIDETGVNPDSYTWAEAALEPWCTKKGDRYYIENVTIDASGSPPEESGIFINNSINTYFTIKNCTITGASYAGIYLHSTCNGTLINNNCSNNDLGVSIRGSVTPFFRSANNTIVNNTLSWNNYGFQCWSADDNLITNNTLNNNDLFGISNAGRANNNNFTYNIIRDDDSVNPRVGYGIGFFNGDGSNIINNTIINCESYGINLQYDSNGNTIENNTIINSLGTGINIYGDAPGCQNNEVINNTIINAGKAGIRLLKDITSTTIIDNTIKFSEAFGIYIAEDSHSTIILNNDIYDNEDYGIFIENSCNNTNILANRIIETGIGGTQEYGIYIKNTCYYTIITGNTVFNHTKIGIYIESNWNDIKENTVTFNDNEGIYLNHSNYNNIQYNTAKNNTYGLRLVNSSYNCIYGNILVNNTIQDYNESGICVRNIDCRPAGGLPAAGDDDDDDEEDTGVVVVIVVVVIIVCVCAGVVVIFILIKKGIIDLSKSKKT